MAVGDHPRTRVSRRTIASSSWPHGRSMCRRCSLAETPTAASAHACLCVKQLRAATASRAALFSASEDVPEGGPRSAGMPRHRLPSILHQRGRPSCSWPASPPKSLHVGATQWVPPSGCHPQVAIPGGVDACGGGRSPAYVGAASATGRHWWRPSLWWLGAGTRISWRTRAIPRRPSWRWPAGSARTSTPACSRPSARPSRRPADRAPLPAPRRQGTRRSAPPNRQKLGMPTAAASVLGPPRVLYAYGGPQGRYVGTPAHALKSSRRANQSPSCPASGAKAAGEPRLRAARRHHAASGAVVATPLYEGTWRWEGRVPRVRPRLGTAAVRDVPRPQWPAPQLTGALGSQPGGTRRALGGVGTTRPPAWGRRGPSAHPAGRDGRRCQSCLEGRARRSARTTSGSLHWGRRVTGRAPPGGPSLENERRGRGLGGPRRIPTSRSPHGRLPPQPSQGNARAGGGKSAAATRPARCVPRAGPLELGSGTCPYRARSGTVAALGPAAGRGAIADRGPPGCFGRVTRSSRRVNQDSSWPANARR